VDLEKGRDWISPRAPLKRLDGDPWVEIPGGTFTMGDRVALQSIKPRRQNVGSFRVFCRPMTVQDYAAFVRAGGYAEQRFWAAGRGEEATSEPNGWTAQHFHLNRPVVGVSWYEARAFCCWASEAWGMAVDLPLEAEWEFAARGPEGAPYPWGEEEAWKEARANHDWGDEGIGHATPVGAFPKGNRWRLLDLAGNVWEWCLDPWTDDGRPEAFSVEHLRGAPRVVRGGSWDVGAGLLRGAYRSGCHPGERSGDLGFRVVVRGARQP
jgi:formylglycine-generating enzyme required for sulfatase activity